MYISVFLFFSHFSTAEAEFPALTICPDFDDAYKTQILEDFGVSALDIRRGLFTKMKNKSFTTYVQYQMATHELSEIVDQMKIQLKVPLKGTRQTYVRFVQDLKMYQPSKTTKFMLLDPKDWIVQNYLVFGRCYTMEMPITFRKHQITYITFTVKLEALLYIHHAGQFFWIDSDTKVPIITNETSFLNTNHEVVYARPKMSKFGVSCSSIMNSGYDRCVKRENDQVFQKHFNCNFPFSTKFENQTDLCDFGRFTEKDINIYDAKLRGGFRPNH